MNGGDQRGQGQSYGGGLPLSEFNKLVPPGWRPGIPGYPINLFFERLKLWYRVTDNAEAQLGILVAGRLQGAPQKIALRLRLPRPVAAGGGYDIGDEALIRLSQEQVIDPATNTIVQEYIPSGLQFLCQALRAIYGLQDQDRTTVALDSFYEFKRGHLGLAEFAQEFDHRYESAEDEAGLQMNDTGKTYFFLRGSGLGDKIIEDIKLQMRGDMSRYQEIRTLVLKLARASDKDKETLNMYQDQTDFNYKVNLDETNGNYYGSWHDPTTGEIIEYDYGANTSDDMYYGDYDCVYDGEYSDYDGAGYDDDWYGDQGKGKGGKDYHYENFWKGKCKGKKGGKSKGFGKGWSKGFGKYRPSFGSGKGYGKYSGGYGKSYGKSYGKGKFKGGYGGFRYSSRYNFTAFQDYEVQEAPEHAPIIAFKADGSGTQYYDFEDEKPSSSTRPPPQSTTEPMIDIAGNPGYNDGYGELDTATAPMPDVRVNSLSFLVGACSSAFPTDHEDWSSLYHSVRGVKRHGLLIDPGAASGLIGSDTLKEFRDEILLPLGVDIICRPTTQNVSGISGKPEPALSRVTMPIFPGIKSSTFTADVIGKQGSKCPALLPNPSMRAANMGLLTNFFENGDGMLIVHDNGKRLLYRCLLTESGHYILPTDNVKNNNNVDEKATRKASAFYAAVLQDATQQWRDISSVYLAVDKAAVADPVADRAPPSTRSTGWKQSLDGDQEFLVIQSSSSSSGLSSGIESRTMRRRNLESLWQDDSKALPRRSRYVFVCQGQSQPAVAMTLEMRRSSDSLRSKSSTRLTNTIVQEYIPSGLQFLCQALRAIYGLQDQDRTTVALDSFYEFKRGHLGLAEFAQEFDHRYESAEDEAGLQMNDTGKTYFFLRGSGLGDKIIEDIKLQMRGDMSRYQEIRTLVLKLARASDKDKETLNMYQDQTDFNYKVNLDDTNGNYYGSWHDPTTGEIIEYDYGANTSDDMYYGDYDCVYDGEYSDYDGAGYDDDWYGDDETKSTTGQTKGKGKGFGAKDKGPSGDQGKGKGGKDYHYEDFWKGYGKSYGKSYGKGKFKGGYGGFRYSSRYNFTAFQDYEVQEAPEHAPIIAFKADGSGTQYYDFEDEKPSSSTRPPPQSTTEPMIDIAGNPGYNDGYGELDTATAPMPDVRVNSLSFLVGTCSSAFPTDHEDWSSLYHSVRGVKRHGLLIDPGAASGLIGSDTLKEFRDEILLPLGVDIICRPTTQNVSGISGKPEPALSRVTMPIFPGIKSSTFTADVIGKQGSKCPALLPNPSMRAANMGLLTNFFENGDGMLIVHDNGKRLLYRCLLTESGHYILPTDNVKNNNNVDKE
ncbi:unnamed protein product, partial [Polarella glacialis]